MCTHGTDAPAATYPQVEMIRLVGRLVQHDQDVWQASQIRARSLVPLGALFHIRNVRADRPVEAGVLRRVFDGRYRNERGRLRVTHLGGPGRVYGNLAQEVHVDLERGGAPKSEIAH